MELNTTIEFSVDEFSKIDNVINKLTSEGWSLLDSKKYQVIDSKGNRNIVAKKYWFIRTIN